MGRGLGLYHVPVNGLAPLIERDAPAQDGEAPGDGEQHDGAPRQRADANIQLLLRVSTQTCTQTPTHIHTHSETTWS
jgi:hypothetical protein